MGFSARYNTDNPERKTQVQMQHAKGKEGNREDCRKDCLAGDDVGDGGSPDRLRRLCQLGRRFKRSIKRRRKLGCKRECSSREPRCGVERDGERGFSRRQQRSSQRDGERRHERQRGGERRSSR